MSGTRTPANFLEFSVLDDGRMVTSEELAGVFACSIDEAREHMDAFSLRHSSSVLRYESAVVCEAGAIRVVLRGVPASRHAARASAAAAASHPAAPSSACFAVAPIAWRGAAFPTDFESARAPHARASQPPVVATAALVPPASSVAQGRHPHAAAAGAKVQRPVVNPRGDASLPLPPAKRPRLCVESGVAASASQIDVIDVEAMAVDDDVIVIE